jgi:DNA-binding CsgD family transcriptional regulator
MPTRNEGIKTFIDFLNEVHFDDEPIDTAALYKMANHFNQVASYMTQSAPILFIYDYTKSSYISVSENTREILQHDARDFLKGGFHFFFNNYHPDDFKIFNHEIAPFNINFLISVPQHFHQRYVFSHNFRLLNRLKQPVHLYQRSIFITSQKSGLPLCNIGMAVDVNNLKKDSVIHHSIEECQFGESGNPKKLVMEKYYYPDSEDKLFTRRERDILDALANGMSSKEISDKLFISEHTVISHRRNMHQKTNTKNIAALIAYAIRRSII